MHNILILGSGGREHCLTWKITQSEQANKIFVAPGNGGTLELAQNVELKLNDFKSIANFSIENQISLIIVGPEQPLVDGIVDYFEKNHADIMVFGPHAQAAQLEGSKDFANEFLQRHSIPTAAHKTFTLQNIERGKQYISEKSGPYVLKADGLAAGKGVLIIDDQEVAKKSLEEMLEGKFGAASEKVIIEDFLDGIEFSVFVITDGKDYFLLPEAKDYKRIGENDTGLNTGGMGAISPVPFVDEIMMKKVHDRIIKPTINGLHKDQIPYRGFIFFGLINVNGDPYVIEYNCRMGDPETEVVLPRVENDLLQTILASFNGKLSMIESKVSQETAATVMLVSGGYPESYEKGKTITFPPSTDETIVFQAGTKKTEKGLVTNGGRVMALTSFGKDKNEAVRKSLDLAKNIRFEKKYFRTDIGFDL